MVPVLTTTLTYVDPPDSVLAQIRKLGPPVQINFAESHTNTAGLRASDDGYSHCSEVGLCGTTSSAGGHRRKAGAWNMLRSYSGLKSTRVSCATSATGMMRWVVKAQVRSAKARKTL